MFGRWTNMGDVTVCVIVRLARPFFVRVIYHRMLSAVRSEKGVVT